MLLNITHLSVSVVVNTLSGAGLANFKANINNNFTVNFYNIKVCNLFPRTHMRSLQYTHDLNAIDSGVNILQLYDLSGYQLLIYRVNIFIEYEYQA